MKKALITGASRGLGRELALRLTLKGYELVMCSRKPSTISKYGIYVEGDVRSQYDLDRIVKACGDNLDLLINNAGMYWQGDIEDVDREAAENVIDTNLIGPIMLTGMLWPLLRKSKGMVVNVNSVAGLRGSRGELLYSASKFGLRGFFQSLRPEAAIDGVRILDVFLGAMKTCMTQDRSNYSTFMDVGEVADVIAGMCDSKDTVQVSEVTLWKVGV